MNVLPWSLRTGVTLMAFYLVVGLPLQIWSYWVAPVPWMNYGPPLWPALPAYGAAAPYVGFLLWRRSPRARLATYVFLTFDVLRSARVSHWLPLAIDIVIVLYLQTPAMRRLYPSMWSRRSRMLRPWGRE